MEDTLDWERAAQWIVKANQGREEWEGPIWRFDCGFKLDYDGPLLRVSSRFYPPHKNGRPVWEGDVDVYILTTKIRTKNFETESLEELKNAVDEYVSTLIGDLQSKRITKEEISYHSTVVENFKVMIQGQYPVGLGNNELHTRFFDLEQSHSMLLKKLSE